MKPQSQHLDDTTIPIIEIAEGWAAESVQTLEECIDAYAYLMAACAEIEFQIDIEIIKPETDRNKLWLARARRALKYKKSALEIVYYHRQQIQKRDKRTRDKKLLEHIRATVSNETFMGWVSEALNDQIADCA